MRHGRITAAGIFAAALLAGAGIAQDKVKVKSWDPDETMTVKGADEKVKIKKSGSSYKVKGTGEKFKMKETGSGYKVKGADVKLRPSRSAARKASEPAAPAKATAKATPAGADRLPEKASSPAPDTAAPAVPTSGRVTLNSPGSIDE